jgi:hypothetical protein
LSPFSDHGQVGIYIEDLGVRKIFIKELTNIFASLEHDFPGVTSERSYNIKNILGFNAPEINNYLLLISSNMRDYSNLHMGRISLAQGDFPSAEKSLREFINQRYSGNLEEFNQDPECLKILNEYLNTLKGLNHQSKKPKSTNDKDIEKLYSSIRGLLDVFSTNIPSTETNPAVTRQAARIHTLNAALEVEIGVLNKNPIFLNSGIYQYSRALERISQFTAPPGDKVTYYKERSYIETTSLAVESWLLDSYIRGNKHSEFLDKVLDSLGMKEKYVPSLYLPDFQTRQTGLSYLYAKHNPTPEAKKQAIEKLGENHPLSQLLEIRASFQKEHNQTLRSPKKQAKKTSPNSSARGFTTQVDPYKQTRTRIKVLLRDLSTNQSSDNSEPWIDPRKEIKMLKLIRENQPMHQLHVLFQEELQKVES